MTAKDLKETRAALGLTQSDLAERLQVSWRTIARWESGQVGIPYLADLALIGLTLATGARPDET